MARRKEDEMIDFADEVDVEAIYKEGRFAYANSTGGNPYNDNFRADFWAHGFQDAKRAAERN